MEASLGIGTNTSVDWPTPSTEEIILLWQITDVQGGFCHSGRCKIGVISWTMTGGSPDSLMKEPGNITLIMFVDAQVVTIKWNSVQATMDVFWLIVRLNRRIAYQDRAWMASMPLMQESEPVQVIQMRTGRAEDTRRALFSWEGVVTWSLITQGRGSCSVIKKRVMPKQHWWGVNGGFAKITLRMDQEIKTSVITLPWRWGAGRFGHGILTSIGEGDRTILQAWGGVSGDRRAAGGGCRAKWDAV